MYAKRDLINDRVNINGDYNFIGSFHVHKTIFGLFTISSSTRFYDKNKRNRETSKRKQALTHKTTTKKHAHKITEIETYKQLTSTH